jgi:hypothetical protein
VSVATARITVSPCQSIRPDIDDLIPTEGDVIGIAGAAFHELIPHPLKQPPHPVFEHLFRSRHGSRVGPMMPGYFLRTGHVILPVPEAMPKAMPEVMPEGML